MLLLPVARRWVYRHQIETAIDFHGEGLSILQHGLCLFLSPVTKGNANYPKVFVHEGVVSVFVVVLLRFWLKIP